MELGFRDWMIIVGVLLILAVLIDGYRRMRNERRGNIRMSLNRQFLNSSTANDDNPSELPNGGARQVDRAESPEVDRDSVPPLGDGDLGVRELDLEQSVPLLMESVEQQELDVTAVNEVDSDENRDDDYFELEPPPSPHQNNAIDTTISSASEVDMAESFQASPAAAAERQEVVAINVVAQDAPFKGPDLLHILLACDLRFGDMNIFHRHEQANGKGAVQFSMANSVEPGYFDLDTIDDFTTPGVCFFMSVPGPSEPIKAFEYMVETAQCLVTNLGGEMLDDSRSAMTNQTLEHCRQRLQDFERRQLTQQA
ncbi:MAG: cell division protein ZipA [Oceanicoccus sp.]